MAPDAVSRFAGFAGAYDTARPRPPAAVVQVICQWSGAAAPDVVDLGAGTGLSSVIWAGHAATVTAVEPSADMRAVARHRVAQARETDAAYLAADTRVRELEAARGLQPPRADKAGHLARMRDSGLFRHTTEIAVHGLEQGTATGWWPWPSARAARWRCWPAGRPRTSWA
jgi:SAM-dependent methyltransferase